MSETVRQYLLICGVAVIFAAGVVAGLAQSDPSPWPNYFALSLFLCASAMFSARWQLGMSRPKAPGGMEGVA